MNSFDMTDEPAPDFTGRYLMVGTPHDAKGTLSALADRAGLKLASSLDFGDQGIDADALGSGDGIYLNEIGVTILNAVDAEQLSRVAASDDGGGAMLEPERVVHALPDFGAYLRGYRDAVNNVTDIYEGMAGEAAEGEPSPLEALATGSTWGLQKTRTVARFPYMQVSTGAGIRVAVLDTGFDLAHPDFAGRTVVARSFIANEAVQDLNGHGTHCIGTACGPKEPSDPGVDRYGVAFAADIYVGKVLSNAGSGSDGGILAGINWAIANRCQVISMSLGARALGAGFSAVYENAAVAALNAGCLIIAAAGNDHGAPVSHPANCPSIMAVGAVDDRLVKAPFSNVTHFPPQGRVDIVGPGVAVFSSLPVGRGRYGSLSGTSMATPHVAGIAALYAQNNPQMRGAALWQRLISTARPLSDEAATHVGAGLVQAPVVNIGGLPRPFPRPIPRPFPLPIRRPTETASGKGRRKTEA
ncbi:S8 family serine peptidase [Mongoliimonas terrestris]|uniref:S8 family serine peptidase n=1 Tax=Mongoliimonas terrestris TaxID=1709001 RepID=UPI00094990BE|nr:S8 family serine peptidase [Mongoliimonas terrestris]